MRKIIFLLVALFIVPTYILAAIAPTITKLEADVLGKDIKYNGETTTGTYAVMCKIFNNKDEELDLLSSPVIENKFEGSFTVIENGEYKVSCSNYEGGEFKTIDVIVDENNLEDQAKEIEKVQNPKTGDNIVLYISLSLVSIIGIVILVIIKKKFN